MIFISEGSPSQNDQLRKVQYRRNFEKVYAVSLFDTWRDIPEKGYAHYHDFDEGDDMSNPIKIHNRKNGSHYINFEGKRYDIDITSKKHYQFIDDDGKNKSLKEEGFYN